MRGAICCGMLGILADCLPFANQLHSRGAWVVTVLLAHEPLR